MLKQQKEGKGRGNLADKQIIYVLVCRFTSIYIHSKYACVGLCIHAF